MKSDFGKGLGYCLGMFLAHAERKFDENLSFGCMLWFNGAADHLYELEILETLPEKLKERLKKFQSKCRQFRDIQGNATEADINWSIEEAKELLRLIDEAHGIKTMEAEWK